MDNNMMVELSDSDLREIDGGLVWVPWMGWVAYGIVCGAAAGVGFANGYRYGY